MSFLEIMQAYFRGERIEALYYILPAGLLVIGLGMTALLSDRQAFGWSMGLTLIVFGAIAVSTGAYVAWRTPAQVEQLEQQYKQDPATMLAEEMPRMEKVNANWPRLIATWGVLVVIGLALRFGLKADWAHGMGPALILAGAIGFLIDGFAERRARPYTEALQAQAKEHGVATAVQKSDE